MGYALQEGEALDAYGEWVPVDKTAVKAAATSRKGPAPVPIATTTSSSNKTATTAGLPEVLQLPAFVPDADSVFPQPLLQVRSISTICVLECQIYKCISILMTK